MVTLVMRAIGVARKMISNPGVCILLFKGIC